MAVSLPIRGFALPRVGAAVQVGVRTDLILAGSLAAVALVVRWPYLLLSPQFPSISATILLALDIADGRAFPLADQAPYLGSLFMYLLAAAYKVFGASVETTMLVPWAIGGLTVIPTYFLGRELGGRLVGITAAALMATSGAHTVISSHVPLSHSMTPLLVTTTLWLLVRAAARGDGRSLALAGLGAGLSLQTHPTVAPLLGGAAAATLIHRPAWLRTRWPCLAVGLLLLGYSTLLVHHVQSRFEVLADVQSKQARYLDADVDAGENSERGVYLNNLQQLLISTARLTSGAIEEREESSDYVLDPLVLVYPVLGLAGLVVAVYRGSSLLLLGLLPALFLPPLFSGKYEPILDGRYLMPLVPVLFVGIGLALVAGVDALARRLPLTLRTVASALVFTVMAGALVQPLGSLSTFYEESQEDGFSNADYLRVLAQVQAARSEDETILLDDRLKEVKSTGGGNALRNLTWLLAVSRLPSERGPTDDPTGFAGRVAILHRSTAEQLDKRLGVTSLDGGRMNGKDRESYRAYRVEGR
jgi:hypothetical protein